MVDNSSPGTEQAERKPGMTFYCSENLCGDFGP